ncbi:MAG: type II toxin-antitoxin system HicA family toxin [Lachnospiraceae bacterium]|nr:type II toxin-antitoxin system HicA family toxin [Lachnospiraceae bacterium]
MKISELRKLLVRSGCYLYRSGGKHDIWYSPKTGKYFPVPRHVSQEAGTGLTGSILKAAGIR